MWNVPVSLIYTVVFHCSPFLHISKCQVLCSLIYTVVFHCSPFLHISKCQVLCIDVIGNIKVVFYLWENNMVKWGATSLVSSKFGQCSTRCQTFNTRCTKSQNLNVSRLVLQLSLPNPLKPGVKSRMKMQLEQRRHLSDQKWYCPLRYTLY